MKTKYSSETVRLILENEKFTFWSSDWSKKITVHWNKGVRLTAEIKKQVNVLLGKNWGFERSLSNRDFDFVLLTSGLIDYSKIIPMYLDYVNNFITVGGFADHYNLNGKDANYIIDLGRELNNKEHETKN